MQNLTFIDSNGQELARPGSMPGALGIMLSAGGDGADESRGTVLLLLNAGREPVVFKLPDPDPGYTWEGLIDTSRAATLRSAPGAAWEAANTPDKKRPETSSCLTWSPGRSWSSG
jgi:hypothetical protein